MSVTIQGLMDLLPKAFISEKTAGVDAAVYLKLKGEGGGDWEIVIREQKCTTSQGIPQNPKLTLTAEAQDLIDIFTGKLDAMRAFMSGKLKVTGDMNLGMKLMNYFAVTPELLQTLEK